MHIDLSHLLFSEKQVGGRAVQSIVQHRNGTNHTISHSVRGWKHYYSLWGHFSYGTLSLFMSDTNRCRAATKIMNFKRRSVMHQNMVFR